MKRTAKSWEEQGYNEEHKPSSDSPSNLPLLSHIPCKVPSTSLALHFLQYSSAATCSLQIEIDHIKSQHKIMIILISISAPRSILYIQNHTFYVLAASQVQAWAHGVQGIIHIWETWKDPL